MTVAAHAKSRPPPRSISRRASRWRDRLRIVAFLSPWLLGTGLFFIYPLVATGYFSMMKYDGFTPPVWTGFGNWWRSIFGVSLKEDDIKDEESKAERYAIPRLPRAGKGKPEEAVYDFLNSWLVEQQPNQAVAYISPRAYSCIEQVASDEQKKLNPGLDGIVTKLTAMAG